MSLEDLTSAVPAAAEPTPAVETASQPLPQRQPPRAQRARDDMDAVGQDAPAPRG